MLATPRPFSYGRKGLRHSVAMPAPGNSQHRVGGSTPARSLLHSARVWAAHRCCCRRRGAWACHAGEPPRAAQIGYRHPAPPLQQRRAGAAWRHLMHRAIQCIVQCISGPLACVGLHHNRSSIPLCSVISLDNLQPERIRGGHRWRRAGWRRAGAGGCAIEACVVHSSPMGAGERNPRHQLCSELPEAAGCQCGGAGTAAVWH